MTIDVFSPAGSKVNSMALPASLFEGPVNFDLMHQFVVMQQANRRQSPAHVRTRGEVWGSTKKLFSQKHTGRARRGDVRSPTLRGGGKAFGPRNERNFLKDMPKKMRHAALRSCLAVQANKGAVFGLESYPDAVKTKDAATLLGKLPIEKNRRVLLVLDGKHNGAVMSFRNIPTVKTVYAAYLNPEDILMAKSVIFMVDALKTAETLFGKRDFTAKRVKVKGTTMAETAQKTEETADAEKPAKKKAVKKATAKKKATPKSAPKNS